MKTEPQLDPYLNQFLNLLAQDIAQHPEAVQPVAPCMALRSLALVDGVEIDIDKPLPATDE